MVAVVADLAGGRKYRRINTAGALIAPWPVLLGVLLLVADLGKPWRFWEMLLKRSHETLGIESLMFKIGSTMSSGTWLLTIFVLGSLLYLVIALLAYPFKWAATLKKVLGVIGLPFALLVTIYTGILISATDNVLWNNWLLPLVFVSSAFVTGIAAIAFTLAVLQVLKPKSKIGSDVPRLEIMNSRLIVIQLLMVIIFILIGIGSPQMRAMIGTAFGLLWWIGIIGLGLVLPFIISFRSGAKSPQISLFISTLILLGGFFLRYAILISGQIHI